MAVVQVNAQLNWQQFTQCRQTCTRNQFPTTAPSRTAIGQSGLDQQATNQAQAEHTIAQDQTPKFQYDCSGWDRRRAERYGRGLLTAPKQSPSISMTPGCKVTCCVTQWGGAVLPLGTSSNLDDRVTQLKFNPMLFDALHITTITVELNIQ